MLKMKSNGQNPLYTDDLCDKSAYIIRVLHSTIANGRVISIDTSEAEKIPGVVKSSPASI